MKIYPECIPCFIRQALEAAVICGADDEARTEIARKVMGLINDSSLDITPPEMAPAVYGTVSEYTSITDPYADIKKESNAHAMELYPELKDLIAGSEDPLLYAVRYAVAGNVIDHGVPDTFDVKKELEECLKKPFAVFDLGIFKERLERAERVLYLLDNAGEIVFDKLLIEHLGKDVTCVVREKPVINDVTMEDAIQVGLPEVCRVISGGSTIPGTLPGKCSPEFREHYAAADIIISKGQGNYETLSEEKAPIFFIFKAKCPMVCRHLSCNMGDILLKFR